MSCDLEQCSFAEPPPWSGLSPDFAVGRGLGCTQIKPGRLAPRRPALVSARARRSGQRLRQVKANHLKIGRPAVMGVLRESPGSSRRRGLARRRLRCRRTLVSRGGGRKDGSGRSGACKCRGHRVTTAAGEGLCLVSCCCGVYKPRT